MNRARATPMAPRDGFTLVELLTVIVIISILAGLITAAAIRARVSAKNAAAVLDIAHIEEALEVYAQEVGEPPPDFSDQARVLTHVRKRWPNYANGTNWTNFRADVLAGCGLDVGQATPASALVFWLAGIPDAAGRKPRGFNANQANPFQAGSPRTRQHYELGADRLRQGTGGWWEYYAPYLDDAPLVYFRAQVVNVAAQQWGYPLTLQHNRGGTAGIAVPYQDANGAWRNERKFQIISSGADGCYGTNSGPRRSQSGTNCTQEDYDNHANFCKGTIGDEIR